MIKAGYIQRSGYPAKDSDGCTHQITEICIAGRIYVILVRDLRRTLYTGESGGVWRIRQHRGKHLDSKAGKTSISKSKKAVNITLDNGERYTVSAAAVKNILCGSCSYSSVSKIEQVRTKNTVITNSYQSAISPWVSV